MPMLEAELEKYAPIEIVLHDVKFEREFQNSKWATQPEWDNPLWCAILGEEFGEACEALLESRHGADPELLYRELIQVAAVAVAQAQKLRKVLDAAS